jgi:hypothetical protein
MALDGYFAALLHLLVLFMLKPVLPTNQISIKEELASNLHGQLYWSSSVRSRDVWSYSRQTKPTLDLWRVTLSKVEIQRDHFVHNEPNQLS